MGLDSTSGAGAKMATDTHTYTHISVHSGHLDLTDSMAANLGSLGTRWQPISFHSGHRDLTDSPLSHETITNQWIHTLTGPKAGRGERGGPL